MSFLRNAKKFAKDANDINDSLKKMGINTRLGGSKDSNQSSAPPTSHTPASSTYAPSYSTTNDSTVYTPAASSVNVPPPGEDGPSVPVNTADWAQTGKLSLATRKNIRDKWDANKATHEKGISDAFGVPWKIFVDIPGVFSYAQEGSYAQRSMGGTLDEYFDYATRRITEWTAKVGPEGVAEANRLAHRHLVTLEPTTDTANVRYNTTEIIDGRLVILFRHDRLAENIGDAMYTLDEAVNKASANAPAQSGGAGGGGVPLSMHARQSIKKHWEDKVGAELKLSREYLNEPSFSYEPNFEANYAQLVAYEKGLDPNAPDYRDKQLYHAWAQNFGGYTLMYFEGFNRSLRTGKFGDDEMLQEGFNEAVDKRVLKLVVQEKIEKKYSQIKIDDGVLVIRVSPEWWGHNAEYACDDIIDLL